MSENTPMMRQYLSIKEKHKDEVLFFRMGDFYEMFKSDAEEVSRLLNLTLTKRHGIPMCGIPYHAAQNYISRLLNAGKKIAICEQISLPEGGKGIAKRDVVEIITPGTVVDENFLDKRSNNYLASIAQLKKGISFSYIDLSTGEFWATSYRGKHIEDFIRKEISRLSPKEILFQESLLETSETGRYLLDDSSVVVNRMPDWLYSVDEAYIRLTDQFQVSNLKGFGFKKEDIALAAAGVLLDYLKDTAKHYLGHLGAIMPYSEDRYVALDDATRKNLELVKNMDDHSSNYTLLHVLDESCTAMGARKLRQWILNPLSRADEIQKRQNQVDGLYHDQILLNDIRRILSKILDIERLCARIGLDKAHAKDLLALKNSLYSLIEIDDLLKNHSVLSPLLKEADQGLVYQIAEDLNRTIAEEPSILLTEGRMIKSGFHSELDELRQLKERGRSVLEDYLLSIKQSTGINNIKLKYNKIIGYFLEVSKGQASLVPEDFVRRQSLVNAERFTTEKLAEFESKINSASEKIISLEKELFLSLRESLKPHIPLLQSACQNLSALDCFQSLAYVATLRGYIKPHIDSSTKLEIEEGRHPVVEAYLPQGEFVPNGLYLDPLTGDKDQGAFALITGPNMAGKSTYLRQSALIVLMAQIGSYIPASAAQIGVVDKIFCRVGASDNLARGESTFLVEMNETAHILRNASSHSLVIMDEIGRGTSTNDGLSIAWSIAEYLLDKIGCKTLFATHYHELTALEHEKLYNLSLGVEESGSDIVFLKKIKKGPAGSSYGIHVASLAGLPKEVVYRAGQIVDSLQQSDIIKGNPREFKPPVPSLYQKPQELQGSLFSKDEMVLDQLKTLNINDLTPLEALMKLSALQGELKD